MSAIRLIDSIDDSRWDDFASHHSCGTIYHTTAWQRVIKDAYHHRPLYIVLETEDKNIVGGIPLFVVNSKLSQKKLSAVPCAQYCNPLARNQKEYEKILNYLIKLMRNYNCKYIEIKTTDDFKLQTVNFGDAFTDFYTYQLDLKKSINDISKSFHKSCIQRQIKKSYKNNLKLIHAKSEKDVKSFYRLYLTMRKREGLLPQPLKFFLLMWRHLSPHNYIDILLCKKDNIIASAILILKYRDFVTYEYGGSKPEMLKYGVSHFLLWEAIKDAWDKGYRKFDFGRTSDENIGLSQFKVRWGTEKVALTSYIIPKTNNCTLMREKKALRKLMNLTISNFPACTGHLIGSALYRHLV